MTRTTRSQDMAAAFGVEKEQESLEQTSDTREQAAGDSLNMEESNSFLQQRHDHLAREREELISHIENLERRLQEQETTRTARNIDRPGISPDTRRGHHVARQEDTLPRKPLITPDRYDGSAPWQSFFSHFEICASINQWSLENKARFLAAALKGRAQTVLQSLPFGQHTNFEAMVTLLRTRFDPEGREQLYRTQLRGRRQKPKETLMELAQDIQINIDRAYSEMAETAKDELAIDYFLGALPDSEVRTRILQMRPSSLQDALRSAIELEAISTAEQERTGNAKSHPSKIRAATEQPPLGESDAPAPVREVRNPQDNGIKELSQLVGKIQTQLSEHTSSVQKMQKSMETRLKSLTDDVTSLKAERPATSNSVHRDTRWGPPPTQNSGQPVQNRPRTFQCFRCGGTGHMARNCQASPGNA